MKDFLYILIFALFLFIYVNKGNISNCYYLDNKINSYEIKNNRDTIEIQKRDSKDKLIVSIKLIYNDGEYYWVINEYDKVLALTSKKARSFDVYKSKHGIKYKTFSRKLYPRNLYYTSFEPYGITIIYDSLYNIKEVKEQHLSKYKQNGLYVMKFNKSTSVY